MSLQYTKNPYYKALRAVCREFGSTNSDMPEDLFQYLWKCCENQLGDCHKEWVEGFFAARIGDGTISPMIFDQILMSGVIDIKEPFAKTETCANRLPIEAAVASGVNVAVIKAMLDAGADPEKTSPSNGYSALDKGGNSSKYSFLANHQYIKENLELKEHQQILENKLDHMMTFLQQMNLNPPGMADLPHKKAKQSDRGSDPYWSGFN